MWPESAQQPLRTGLTTGTCATACAIAAARLLLGQPRTTHCEVTLPKGQHVTLDLCECQLMAPNIGYAATIKDAGDDPDVTHGATIFASVTLIPEAHITFVAATGVGTVTRAGLALAIGEPAINPTPRRMIRLHLEAIKSAAQYTGGFCVAIGIHNGASIATKTMNPRLGIVGGLSILGTTGIVRPFSCAAYIASIHQGIDVARANGVQHMAACTGNLSEQYAQRTWQLEDMALLEMGDFVGAVLKYAKHHPVPRLSLVGGFGKISKLACGHKDLHSRKCSIDFAFLADCAAQLGAPEACQTAIEQANTSLEALSLAPDYALADKVCESAWRVVNRLVQADMQVDVWAVDRQGHCIGQAGDGIMR